MNGRDALLGLLKGHGSLPPVAAMAHSFNMISTVAFGDPRIASAALA
jgi:hypothetical protein